MRLMFLRNVAFTMFALSFCFLSAYAGNLPDEDKTMDESVILQKCLDLPGLQTYFPSNTDGSKKQVNILQHPVVFASNLSVEKFGLPVLFVGRHASTELDAYVSVTTFTVSENTASVSLVVTYGRNSSKPGSVKVSVALSKTESDWKIIESTLNP